VLIRDTSTNTCAEKLVRLCSIRLHKSPAEQIYLGEGAVEGAVGAVEGASHVVVELRANNRMAVY
jgi:hypothetical protein